MSAITTVTTTGIGAAPDQHATLRRTAQSPFGHVRGAHNPQLSHLQVIRD